jgi:predicted RecA/RadA family phage recombinase
MAKNYVQEGKVIPFTAAADVKSGQVVVVGTLAGVSMTDVARGGLGQLAITGVWEIPAATAEIVQWAPVYWDDDGNPVGGNAGSGAATATSSNNTPIGIAVAGKDAAVGTVRVLLGWCDSIYTPQTALAGQTVAFTAGADYDEDDVVVVGSIVGVCLADVANGAEGLMAVTGEWTVPAATAEIALGAAVYWDADGDPVGGSSGAGAATATSAGNILMGHAVAAKAAAGATVTVLLTR